ncbi:alpha/beta fold hydrolase [Microbacterium sp. BK668]|uniref:alpha/beta hydrolase family protein n=1 Tax=Microbacterium sp. BK668 TaxID=2512118 RepID=UPI00105EF959|nr:alpha/beta fold hydrolase [Microbacterium sp. BK668]TDN92072.1 alpha/beta hydrolase family protein [Microbacterium sp. BK668]
MAGFAVEDDFFDGQTLRAAGTAPYGGADVLECIAIARRVKKRDLDSWHDEWAAAGRRAFALGEEAEASARADTAKRAFLRACTYFRTSGIAFLGSPVDPRLRESLVRQREAFRRAIPYLGAHVQIVEIPLGKITLPGYYFRVADDDRRRATVILTNGYDGTVEEMYFGNAQAALDRGYDVLAFDGPGQGAVLIEQGVTLRPDWENVVPTVVDWLLERPGADPERIALIGWSLGGFLAPRAASGEHRLAACIADANFYDLFDAVLDRLPMPVRAQIPDGNEAAVAIVQSRMDKLMKKPTEGWSLRRGLYVNGVGSMMDYVRDARRYTLKGLADRITCPTLICHGELDPIASQAPLTFAALTCPKELITFLAVDGAGDHCEVGARQHYHARSFGWLDSILEPTRLS